MISLKASCCIISNPQQCLCICGNFWILTWIYNKVQEFNTKLGCSTCICNDEASERFAELKRLMHFYKSGPQCWHKCSTQRFAVPGTLHLAWVGIKPTTYTALRLLFSSDSYCQPDRHEERKMNHTHTCMDAHKNAFTDYIYPINQT